MRRPLERGAPQDQNRFDDWLANVAGYRDAITQGKIENWLRLFAAADADIAARVLDAIQYFGVAHIRQVYRDLLHGLNGWSANAAQRTGRWFFVPFSGSIGESGDSMMHIFRQATGMAVQQHDALFIHRSEIVAKRPGRGDTLVFVDDFSGSGEQVCTAWEKTFAELVTEGPRVVLLLVAATTAALVEIRNRTSLEPQSGTALGPDDDIFSAACQHFTQAEKDTLHGYCLRADHRRPKGFGDCGLLVVLAHRCPNNSIPVLHASKRQWSGLFPRHD